MFQFYDSPIKRGLLQVDNRIRLSFQFYDSPIKSLLMWYLPLRATSVSIL